MYQSASGNLDQKHLAALLLQDPNNPDAWCSYAEYQALQQDFGAASQAFERAMKIAPGLPSVAMRAANFYFTHNQREKGFALSKRILTQTDAFDEILFSYLRLSPQPISQTIGYAIPADPRAARSWLHWMLKQDAPRPDVLAVWDWMKQNHLGNEESAVSLVNYFWRQHTFQTAYSLWSGWQRGESAKSAMPAGGRAQLLNNPTFAQPPNPVPFDWNLTASPAVEFVRGPEGLDVHFLGADNADFRGLRQYAALPAGQYRLEAEISAEGLTTDQTPFFQIEDSEVASRLSARTPPLPANTPHSTVTLKFTVPPETRTVDIHLARLPSLKFDNKIAGHLRVHSVKLVQL